MSVGDVESGSCTCGCLFESDNRFLVCHTLRGKLRQLLIVMESHRGSREVPIFSADTEHGKTLVEAQLGWADGGLCGVSGHHGTVGPLGTRGCPGEGEGDDVVEVLWSVATLPTKPASMLCSGSRCEGPRSGVGGVGRAAARKWCRWILRGHAG